MVERGKWGNLFVQAHSAYKPRRPADDSLLRYMFLAELGYEVALSNAAFILDRGDLLLLLLIAAHFQSCILTVHTVIFIYLMKAFNGFYVQ